jgi:VWFA-related protein
MAGGDSEAPPVSRRQALAVAAFFSGVVLTHAWEPQTTYRARTDVVVVDAVVSDGRKPIRDLVKEDFELRDNGVVQQIADFSRETLPLDVRVTIDISGSMTPADRGSVERALARLSGALGPADRVSVTTFSSDIIERTALQPPPLAVDLSHGRAGQGTAVFDALLLSLITAPSLERRQFVLFMTDGDDTASYFDGRVAVETARHANAPTTIVLVANRAPVSVLGVFRGVASTTGGDLIELKGREGLSDAFLAALERFRSSYVLRYSPAGVARTGWHDIVVTLKSKPYTVRARRGYWADSVRRPEP